MEETKVKGKFNKGITLIALVITIIVLLILAGVSIATLTGDNGVLTQATNASEKTTISKEEELIKLAWDAVLMDKLPNGNKEAVTADELKNQLQKDNTDATISTSGSDTITVKFDKNTYTVDKDGKVTYIPGTVELEPSNLKWIYHENENGKMEITGIDVSDYRYTDDGAEGYYKYIKLNIETLVIPSKLEGKDVVKLDWKDTILPFVSLTWGIDFKDVKKIIYPNTIEEITNTANGWDVMFSEVEEMQLPNNLKVIGDWAFTRYYSLKNITIPETVTTIGYNAFNHCETLQNVTIPDNVTEIGRSAFSQCYNLQNIEISENVTKIGVAAFANCSKLQNVDISQNLTSIGDSAFWRCGTVNFPNGKNSELEMPSDKWGASKVVISGVEQ